MLQELSSRSEVKKLSGQVKMSLKRSYANGYKYCSRCRAYYKTDDVRCPYCRILLRSSPRKKKFLRNVKTVEALSEVEGESSKIEVAVETV